MATQLLSGFGFKEAYNVKGGIKAWQGQKAAGPVELNLDLIKGDETPGEIVVFAYGLEKGLQTFYGKMIEKTDDQELKDLFQIILKSIRKIKIKYFIRESDFIIELLNFMTCLKPRTYKIYSHIL